MKTVYLDTIDSTQSYLKGRLEAGDLKSPCAVIAKSQFLGKGSRGNEWQGVDGNFFASISVLKDELPSDLKLESSSIYFAQILKETLRELKSEVWLKWPNDFYIEDKKIGGLITTVFKENIICGIGLNTCKAPDGFDKLDVSLDNNKLLEDYLINLEKKKSWKQIFSNYEIEFYKSKKFLTHCNNKIISLKDVKLNSDGSIEADGQRIYSLR